MLTGYLHVITPTQASHAHPLPHQVSAQLATSPTVSSANADPCTNTEPDTEVNGLLGSCRVLAAYETIGLVPYFCKLFRAWIMFSYLAYKVLNILLVTKNWKFDLNRKSRRKSDPTCPNAPYNTVGAQSMYKKQISGSMLRADSVKLSVLFTSATTAS